VQPFLDVRTAVLNDTLGNAFRRRYSGFRPTNDDKTIAEQRNEPHSFNAPGAVSEESLRSAPRSGKHKRGWRCAR